MSRTNDMTIKLGGEAGQGVESSGAGFLKAMVRGGLYCYGLQDYQSRIRGGHNYYQIRVSSKPLFSWSSDVHVLMAFDDESLYAHPQEIVPGGAIIFDEGLKYDKSRVEAGHTKMMPVPLYKLALEIGGDKVMANTVALGVTSGITGYDFEKMADVIRQNFRRKGEKVIAANLGVAEAGYRYGLDNFAADFEFKLEAIPNAPKRMALHAHQAFCMGALAAGCRFNSAYPMTPGTSVIEWMTAKANKFDVLTKQTEDELSAILMAIGAAQAGMRALTNTSGGGFSLMVEALGLAGMTEIPLVIVDAQRGGPSTGLPTKTEQSDLAFVTSAGHGEFPRAVLAPGSVQEAFEAGWRAFNLAEKYQMPVLVLTDMMLSTSIETLDLEQIDFSKVEIDRGDMVSNAELDALADSWAYKRHAVTDSGVSPRALPGHPNSVYITTGDEHSPDGLITEDPATRVAQMEKRMRKMESALATTIKPLLYGPTEADVTVIGWGSTYGAIRQAVDAMNTAGESVNFLHYVDVWPFPVQETEEAFAKMKFSICIEQNFTGQFARLLRAETGLRANAQVLRYDGHPYTEEDAVAFIRRAVAEKDKPYNVIRYQVPVNSGNRQGYAPSNGHSNGAHSSGTSQGQINNNNLSTNSTASLYDLKEEVKA